MRILAVDHGSKHIGLAISDPSGTLAAPLVVIQHIARLVDASRVADQACQHAVELIVIGQSLDEHGEPNLQGRRSARFAEALRSQVDLPIVFWDESFTTQDARQVRIHMDVPRRKRLGHLDALAAAVLLQSYLDANHPYSDR